MLYPIALLVLCTSVSVCAHTAVSLCVFYNKMQEIHWHRLLLTKLGFLRYKILQCKTILLCDGLSKYLHFQIFLKWVDGFSAL